MFKAILLAGVVDGSATMTDPRWDMVVLADAKEFGVQAPSARGMWISAKAHIDHYNPIVWTYYSRASYARWKCEAETCHDAWDSLDNALNSPFRDTQLQQLDRLRHIIGDEDYRARRMPLPSPGWMFARGN